MDKEIIKSDSNPLPIDDIFFKPLTSGLGFKSDVELNPNETSQVRTPINRIPKESNQEIELKTDLERFYQQPSKQKTKSELLSSKNDSMENEIKDFYVKIDLRGVILANLLDLVFTLSIVSLSAVCIAYFAGFSIFEVLKSGSYSMIAFGAILWSLIFSCYQVIFHTSESQTIGMFLTSSFLHSYDSNKLGGSYLFLRSLISFIGIFSLGLIWILKVPEKFSGYYLVRK